MKMRFPKINKYAGMLLVALALAGVSVYLIITYLHQTKNHYQAELQSKLSAGMAQVVVPTTDLASGTAVDGSNMAQRLFPRDLLYPNTITAEKWAQFAGHSLNRPVQAGKPLLETDFTAEGISEFASLLHENNRAVTITVDEVNSIAGMLQPGDHIDIMLSSSSGSGQASLLPLLQHVLVLATGSSIDQTVKPGADVKNGAQDLSRQYSTLTLELTPKQASDLLLGRQMGALKIALTPGKMPPGAPNMPMLTGRALMARLSGDELKPRMRGTGGIQFIIGSTQGVSSHTAFSGQAPVVSVPARQDPEPQAASKDDLRKRATDALTNLIQADTPASGIPPARNPQ